MGTKMPMKAPEAQAYRVNATSILWPSKSENADYIMPKVKQTKGYAIRLATKTCLNAPPKICPPIYALLAPITFKMARSNLCLSTPIWIVLSSIKTLNRNNDTIMDFSITPMNMPKYCSIYNWPAMGIYIFTDKKPTFWLIF